MKKIIAVLLVMMLLAGITVYAGNTSGGRTITSAVIDVSAKYTETVNTLITYSADIEWTDMNFEYAEHGTRKWNADDHTYTDDWHGGWTKDTATVSVTNHSNADVYVDMRYDPNSVDYGIVGALSGGSGLLSAGIENKPNEADCITGTLKIKGTPNRSLTEEGVEIGTVKVTISDIK